MTGAVRTGQVTAGDLPTVGLLFEAAFGEPYGRAAVADLLTHPGRFGLIARDAEPVGFAIAAAADDEAEILSIGVPPRHRRKGVGSALLRGVVETARGMGAATVFLEVAADNAPAAALYRGFGFRQVGLRRNYYRRSQGRRVDARILALDIPGRAGKEDDLATTS